MSLFQLIGRSVGSWYRRPLPKSNLVRRLRHIRRSVRSQACALSAGRLVGLASLNCSTLIFDTNKNSASGKRPCARNADGAVMC